MRRASLAWALALVLVASSGVVLTGSDVGAQTKKGAKGGKVKKVWKNGKLVPVDPAPDEGDDKATKDAKDAKDPKTLAKDSKEPKAEGTKESKSGGAETKATTGSPSVLETKSEGDGGVKTYKFGPVEVEGRLKSPQVVYFMRRVRAEFAAGMLGHRSFMRELSDTRRSPAVK
ncbi:MAG: hypothetical protein IPI67_35115 [Myxococcales bacterium]|nr:hypothetical protein [Myxococcales bacterium]